MKRTVCMILSMIIIMSSSTGMASSMSEKYDEALELFMQEKYNEAAMILDTISIYSDASQLSLYCKSIEAGKNGDYETAYSMLDALDKYKDSAIWATYFRAREAEDKGDATLAYGFYKSINLFLDSSERMTSLRGSKNASFKKEYLIKGYSCMGDNGWIVVKKGDKYGYADLNGNITLEPQWDSADPFYDGRAIVEDGLYKHYLIDTKGEIINSFAWSNAERMGSVYKIVSYSSKKNTYGLMDVNGNTLITPEYDYISAISDELFMVELNDKYGAINSKGISLTDIEYDYIYDLKENRIRVRKNNKYGYLDENGNVIIDIQFEDANEFVNGIAKVKQQDKWGYIDTLGNVVIAPEYEELGTFSEGLVAAKLDGKYGYINEKGEMVLPNKWDNAGTFSEGVAIVIEEDKSYIINQQGKIEAEINAPNCICWSFKDGIAIIAVTCEENGEVKKKMGLIDIKGNIVIDPLYSYIFRILGLLILQKGDSWSDVSYGIANSKGDIILEPEYQDYYPCNEEYILLSNDSNWYIINKDGIVL